MSITIPIPMPISTIIVCRKLTSIICSAGGGGNSKDRKEKIEAKNKKLFEERQRNAKEIQKEKQRLEKVEETGVDDYAHIHPSRRPRMA